MGIVETLQSYWTWLTTDPVNFIVYFIYLAVAILATLILHECAHAYVAYKCGDPTAKMMGRLTLNPLKHLDPLGTVCMVFLHFGWAKPVPVNPRNFSNYRRDDFLVSVAGIALNLTLFILSTAIIVALNGLLWNQNVIDYYGYKELLSSSGVGYSVLVSGAGEANADLMRTPWLMYIQRFFMLFGTMNLGIAVFNLLPVPPLDGFHLFNDLLFKGKLQLNPQVFRITQLIVLVLCFTGAFSQVLRVVTGAIEGGVLNLFLLMIGKA